MGMNVIEKMKNCKRLIGRGTFHSIVFISPIDLKDGEKGVRVARKVPINPKTNTKWKPKIGSIFGMKI
jgi:hypothetical protein